MTLQGRYIVSQPDAANYFEIWEALNAAFPDWPIAKPSNTPKGRVYDISKVSILAYCQAFHLSPHNPQFNGWRL